MRVLSGRAQRNKRWQLTFATMSLTSVERAPLKPGIGWLLSVVLNGRLQANPDR
jgi:hypothetical protein